MSSLSEELIAHPITHVSQTELFDAMSLLYDHMPGCATLIDEEARLLSMGLSGKALMEVEDFSELSGICWLDVWKGEYAQRAHDAFEHARRTGEAEFEGFAYTASNSPRWWRVKLMKVTLGGKTLFFSISEDITAKRDHDDLSQELSPSQVNRAHEGTHCLELDDHGHVMGGSEEAYQALSAVQGELFFERLFAPVYARITEQIQAGELRVSFESVMCRIGSKHRQVALDLDPRYSIHGERLGWDVRVTDLIHHGTLRKELDLLYSLAPGLILLLSPEARIMTANPVVTRLLCNDPNYITRLPLTAMLTETSRRDFERVFERLKAHPHVKGAQCWLRFKTHSEDVSETWYSASLIYVHEQGLCYVYAVDMTQRREMERSLREVNRTLTTTNQHLEALHHLSHHNVQEPIRKILIHADRIHYELDARDADEDREEKVAQSARVIRQIAEAMRTQLYALITYTSTQRYEIKVALHSFGEIFEAALHRHREEWVEGESERRPMHYTLDEDARDQLIPCDREMTELMLYYIMDNTYKFAKPDESPELNVDVRVGDGVIEVILRDHGMGVESCHIDRILKPFQKLDRQGSGHGMGLAVCQKIMQGHRGHISVASAGLNEGFEVKLEFIVKAAPVYTLN